MKHLYFEITIFNYNKFFFIYRNCVGQNFAMNEIKVVMSRTLKRFKLSIDEKSPEPKFSPKTVLKSSTGIFIKLEKL